MHRFMIALAVLAACDDGTTTDTDTTETGDTGTTTACSTIDPATISTTVTDVDVSCTETEATLDASLTGVSAVGSAVMYLQETGNAEPNWSEEHPLDTIGVDPCLASEELETVLTSLGESTGGFVPGQSSVFTCTGHFNDPDVLTVAVYVEDADDPTITSCLVVGHDPAGLIAGDYDEAGAPPSFDLAGCATGS
jgi:hypothetical protein